MLQEILLALSGHPSPLFNSSGLASFPLVTPAETALLRKLGRLADLNRALRSHVTRISKLHPSSICKAVATSVRQSHLAKFQSHILDVERQILTKDASRVGAYNIVPLASVLNDFEPWTRSFEWLWDLMRFVLPPDSEAIDSSVSELTSCSSAALIDRLSRDSNTGYPDIKALALELLSVGEKAWLRQLNQWFLQTAHGSLSASDFFIESTYDSKQPVHFIMVRQRAPAFVTKTTADSILFIGKMLGYLSGNWAGIEQATARPLVTLSGFDLAHHFHPLALLRSPMVQTQLSTTIAGIRASLSTQVVNGLLPVEKMLETVILMRGFFLLARPSFADALVCEADKMICSRTVRADVAPALDLDTSLAGIIMKEAEVTSVLSRTWAALVPWTGKETITDAHIEWARENLQLQIVKPRTNERENPYNSLLLATPTCLSLKLRPPLDLFLNSQDVRNYSDMCTYLVSIRRGHLHITDLWRQTRSRKEHPAPMGPPRSNRKGAQEAIQKKRQSFLARMRHLRSMWKSASAIAFVLSELGNYMAAEVVQESWKAFQTWLDDNSDNEENSEKLPSRPSTGHTNPRPTSSQDNAQVTSVQPGPGHSLRDPEVLSEAHRCYLEGLRRSLLLDHDGYTKALRSLLAHVDHLVAVVVRLQQVQQKVDLLEEGVLDEGPHNYVQEEDEVTQIVSRASVQLDADVRRLMASLKAIDAERLGTVSDAGKATQGRSDFVPWAGEGVDRLMMRLDFGTVDQQSDVA